MTRPVWLLALALCLPAARAHDLQHTVAQSTAVVVRIAYPDGRPFSFEAYEVLRTGGTVPVQVGRTDLDGRIAFAPGRPGEWRVKAYSEDGHGVDLTLTTTASGILAGADRTVYERYTRVLVGVGLILGVFGLLNLYARRRRTR